MEENFDIREHQLTSRERDFENALRPLNFSDFSGQDKVVDNLRIFVKAARLRAEALDHVLLHGPPGLGKTTLSNIIANELGVGFKVTSGPVLDKPGDLAGVLTSLEPNDVLFIDEIHRLSPVVEEYLYSAMEDYRIDIMIDKGPSARSIQLDLNPFTLVGATTRSGLLTAPLRARFGINLHLEYYDDDVLTAIIRRSAKILNVPCDVQAAGEIASRSRGTPRIANALLRRVRDFAQVKGSGRIDVEIARFALEALNIDRYGLDEIDNKILCTIIDKFKGGPVGLTTIATALGEDPGTIEEVYELCDALVKNDQKNICKELGDVLLHVVFYAKIGSETGTFDIKDVCDKLCEKLIFRHPHVFGEVKADTAEQVSENWEQIKMKEKDGNKSVLSGVPDALPSLIKAYRIQDKARNVGFDWEDREQVWEKVKEEIGEFESEVATMDKEKAEAEFGDVMFSLINAARLYKINPDNALEHTNQKFIRRFNYLEEHTIKQGRNLTDMTLEEMDAVWNEAKKKGL